MEKHGISGQPLQDPGKPSVQDERVLSDTKKEQSMPLEDLSAESAAIYFTAHPRSFADFRYVYPVVSRRAGGISLGVNLNLDKRCNFRCIYCQVDRS